jgi:uncharacterized protein
MLSRTLLLTVSGLLLISCGSSPQPRVAPVSQPQIQPEVDAAETGSINYYLTLAANLQSPDAELYLLRAAAIALEAADTDTAAAILAGVAVEPGMPLAIQTELIMTRARIALLRNEPQTTLVLLNGAPFAQPNQLDNPARVAASRLRAEALMALGQYLAAAREHTRLATLLSPDDAAANNNRIWEILTAAPASSLDARSNLIDSYELRGWLELITLINARQDNIEQQVETVSQWQARWNQHSAAARLPAALAYAVDLLRTRPQRIALMLPQGEAAGRAVYEGFMAAYYDAVSQQQQVPEVIIFDTTGIADVWPAYQQLALSGVDLIVGPLRKDSVRDLQRRESLPVPTLALNYGDEGLRNATNLFQFGLAPEDEIRQIARNAWQAGHRSAAVLTASGDEFRRLQQLFVNAWQSLGGEVVSLAGYGNPASYSETIKQLTSINASEARASALLGTLPRTAMEFTPRRRQDIDFIFLQSNPVEGRQLKPTLGFHFSGDIPVYAMPAIFDGQMTANSNRDLNGISFLDAPWLLDDRDPLQRQTLQIWPDSPSPVRRLRAMGVDAFRLHARIAQMANFPGISIPGATGVLSMRSDGTIARELSSARINDGTVELLIAEPVATNSVSRIIQP